jgi:hypothetical protein
VFAHAAEFRLLPSIAQKLEYNDNIFVQPSNLTPNQKIDDYISTTSGKLQLLTNTERLTMDLSARVDQLFYRDNTNLNSTDQFYNGALRYSLSPRLAVALRGSYNRDSRPDRELLTAGLVLNALRRESSSEGITGEYTLGEKTVAALSYDHGQYWYQDSRFADMSYDASTLTFVRDTHNYVPNTKARLNLGYTGYTFTGLDVNNYEATAGLEYALHEKWTFVIDAGTRYTESRFDAQKITRVLGPYVFVSTENVTSTGTAVVGTAKLLYRGEKTTADLSYNRDVTPAYGSLGTVERDALVLSLSRRLTYELTGSLSTGYFTNKSKAGEYSATALNYETIYVAPTVRYAFNRNMFIEGSYTYTQYENKASETRATRNLFLVRLFIQHAIME